MVARLLRICEHSLFFISCSAAIDPIKPDFVITELLFFMVFAAFIATVFFTSFMGAMVVRSETTCGEQARILYRTL